MECAALMPGLEEQLRAQLRLIDGFQARARTAADPRLKSAWIGQFVRVSNAMALTGNAMARLKWAPGAETRALHALCLPALPLLPGEGDPPPSKNLKTTSGPIYSGIRSLSSPACGGGAERSEAEGGVAVLPLPSRISLRSCEPPPP